VGIGTPTTPSGTGHGSLAPTGTSTTGATISSYEGHDQDATRRIELPDDRPRHATDRGTAPAGDALRGPGDENTDLDDEDEVPPRRGRDIGFAIAGALVGILLTFVVIALTTGGETGTAGTDDAALAEREAELAERDRQIEELDARVMDLEAQLAEVGDDSADRDAELAAQREALDERLAALDARVEEADNRQAALDERANALDQREAAIAEAEADTGSPPTDSDDSDGDGGIDLDDLGETAEGVIDRVLEEIRNLFGRG
jgi:Tfp pilus assembly protein PilN